ncbi:hypothetical protein OB13_07685 [Pontibacter sp. HJ8]
MQAFLLIDLSGEAVFEQPILAWLRQHRQGIATFDLDTQSDDMLQQYAVRLLQETAETVVCVKAGAGDLNRLMPLLEELLQPNPDRLLLLLGEQPRLLRILQARPSLRYQVVADEEELKEVLLKATLT